MAHEFLTAFINNSSTIREKLGADIANAPHKAVMYDANGDVVTATAGDKAIGLLLSDTHQTDVSGTPTAKKGEEVTVLIKNIGLAEAGAAIAKGDLVSVNASGQVVTAAAGEFVFGRAFTAAAAAGELVQVQINHAASA